METQQRQQIAAQIKAARGARGWSQKRLAEEAGVAPNTIGSLEKGNAVQAQSLGSILDALGIEPAAEVQQREGWPPDVHLVVEVIGMWLTGMPESDRPQAVLDLVAHISGKH